MDAQVHRMRELDDLCDIVIEWFPTRDTHRPFWFDCIDDL